MSQAAQTTLQVGIQSFWELTSAFVDTLIGRERTQQALLCGNDEDGTTFFWLQNPLSESTNACAGSDWVVMLLLALIVHTISWSLRWILWEPIANRRMKNVKTWNTTECQRFSMTCQACLHFSLSAVFAWRILKPKEWLFDRQAWTHRSPVIDADFKCYYLLYAARFCSDMVSLGFECRQKDALIAAVLHHLTTLGLVLGSAWVGHTRYGGIIMFFFDWADIPLLLAKACKYLSKDPKDAFQFTANRLFEVFAVLFFATRCVYYNYVVYAAWMDLSNDWVNRVCQYLLLVLVALQTYWMGLIVNAALRIQKNGGVAEDARDDDLKKEQ